LAGLNTTRSNSLGNNRDLAGDSFGRQTSNNIHQNNQEQPWLGAGSTFERENVNNMAPGVTSNKNGRFTAPELNDLRRQLEGTLHENEQFKMMLTTYQK
jgi:hypothetical protein